MSSFFSPFFFARSERDRGNLFTGPMMNTPFIGCYWTARRETREECSRRISECLKDLSDIDGLSSWFLKGRSRKASEVLVDVSIEGVERCLRTNKRDTDSSVIKELGFSFSAWNGNDKRPASVSVTCGVFSAFIMNSVVINFPATEEYEIVNHLNEWETMLSNLIRVWDPENAVLTSNEHLSQKGGGMPWEVGGWLQYKRGYGIRRR